jgi:amphi-Trp domain-containing protein
MRPFSIHPASPEGYSPEFGYRTPAHGFGLPWLWPPDRLRYPKRSKVLRNRGRSTSEFVAKLRRLADALEAGERFEIQVAGERIYVPARAEFNVEHEREGGEEEIEFQLKWSNPSTSS